MPELVKKLAVPPEKRTNYDCKLIAGALHVFISSLAEFKEGLCILCQIDMAMPNSLSVSLLFLFINETSVQDL